MAGGGAAGAGQGGGDGGSGAAGAHHRAGEAGQGAGPRVPAQAAPPPRVHRHHGRASQTQPPGLEVGTLFSTAWEYYDNLFEGY